MLPPKAVSTSASQPPASPPSSSSRNAPSSKRPRLEASPLDEPADFVRDELDLPRDLKKKSKKRRESDLDTEPALSSPVSARLPGVYEADAVAGSSRDTDLAKPVATCQQDSSRSETALVALHDHDHDPAHIEESPPSRKRKRRSTSGNTDPARRASASSGRSGNSFTSSESNDWELEHEQDIKHLNKVLRASCDEVAAKNAEISTLRQQLDEATLAREREMSMRQRMFLDSLMDKHRADRELSTERNRLVRLVASVKAQHERDAKKLAESNDKRLEDLQKLNEDKLNKATQDLRDARASTHAAWLQVQHVQAALDHKSDVLKIYEGDVAELQRVHNEETAEAENQRRGLPPPYDSIPTEQEYLSPYEANKARDAGKVNVQSFKEHATIGFHEMLDKALKRSLDARAVPSLSAHASYQLFSDAASALSKFCRTLEHGLGHMQQLTEQPDDNTQAGKSMRQRRGESSSSASSSSALSHPYDTVPAGQRPSKSQYRFSIAAAIIDTIIDLCYQVVATSETRPPSHDCQYQARLKAEIGVNFRLVDDILLRALKLKADNDPPCRRVPSLSDEVSYCSRCRSDNCGGYCHRLQNISHDIVKLKGLNKALNDTPVHGRSRTFFTESDTWLREMLETDRQNAAMLIAGLPRPRARSPTPVMDDETMAQAMALATSQSIEAARAQLAPRRAPSGFSDDSDDGLDLSTPAGSGTRRAPREVFDLVDYHLRTMTRSVEQATHSMTLPRTRRDLPLDRGSDAIANSIAPAAAPAAEPSPAETPPEAGPASRTRAARARANRG